jgi:KAP family P-loop domain
MPDQPRRPHGAKAAIDALSHEDLAGAIVRHITSLPPGSVISVQGSWGRGKTDVVTRIFDWFMEEAEACRAPEPIWVDPWQYGRPDLIQPIVLRLMERMRKQHQVSDQLKMVARNLLRASNDMVFKAVSTFVPFGSILEAAQPAVNDMIDGLLNNATQSPGADADPVHEMASRFYELVNVVVGSQGQDKARLPLLICVDDLDRCLPDHQIAMLEAIYFLTSAGAHCSFVVALDPVLVQQAARTHYRTDGFDSNQYLDKLFQLRVNLTALQPDKIEAIIDAELNSPKDDPAKAVLLKGLAAGPKEMKAAFGRVFAVPELTNPRLVHRVFERLRLAAAANISKNCDFLRAPDHLEALVVWCAVAERWSQLRQVLQASPVEKWLTNLGAICAFYGFWDDDGAEADEQTRAVMLAEAAAVTSRLPGPASQPDLGEFINALMMPHGGMAVFRQIDDILISFGL